MHLNLTGFIVVFHLAIKDRSILNTKPGGVGISILVPDQIVMNSRKVAIILSIDWFGGHATGPHIEPPLMQLTQLVLHLSVFAGFNAASV